MQIGIITFHDTVNYGATLQAVATYKAISKLENQNVEIIDYRCKSIDIRELPKKKYDFRSGTIKGFIYYLLTKKKNIRKYNEIHRFLIENTKVSSCYDENNIKQTNDKYDCFLIGSDMLWQLDYTDSDLTFFLNFTDKKKVSFATSIGKFWSNNQFELVKTYLNDFAVISVREKNFADFLCNKLDRKVNYVCDPTMLLDTNEWVKYVGKRKIHEKYSLVYMDDLAKNCKSNALNYSKKNQCLLYEIGIKNPLKKYHGYKILEVYGVEEFLNAIYYSEILYTASYHGMLFAIYFHKPFVYYNKDSNRLENLANQLGLQERNGNKYDPMLMKAIDWDLVDEKRVKFSKKSLECLDSCFL